MPKKELLISDANKVRIYIWRFKERKKGKSWHTALKTYTGGSDGTGYYASHFTSPSDPSRGVMHTECDDRDALGEPDKKIDLYSLNVGAINREYERLCKRRNPSSLFGSIEMDGLRGDGRNCCGLTVSLLKSGDIDKLVEYRDEAFAGSVGAATGIGSSLFVGTAATAGVAAAGGGILASVLIGGPIVLAFAGIAFLVGGTAGAVTGGVTGAAIDTLEGRKNIITPNGVEKLVSATKESEENQYLYVIPRIYSGFKR